MERGCAEQLRDKGGESTAERQRCAPGGTASGDEDAAAFVQRLQPVEEVGVMAGASVPRPPLLSALQGKPQKMAALDVQRVVHRHQGWRLISCMWLHAGVFHMLANMLSLVFIGIRLEQEFGFVRIGFLYLMSGFGGSLLSAIFIQYGISVGASGALFGLLGSMLSEPSSNWTMYVNKLAALLTLLFLIIINLAVGILPHVDNFARIGGFVSGFLLGFFFFDLPPV